MQTLSDYELPTDFAEIKAQNPNQWKRNVKRAIEKQNKQRLIEECHTRNGDQRTPKTKTAFILNTLKNPSYERNPLTEIGSLSKIETKTLMIARYGMLECGKNFKGTMSLTCDRCNCLDDEEHRLNSCLKFNCFNFCNEPDQLSFDTVYSSNIGDIKSILNRIKKVWNVKTGHGSMNPG